MGTRCWSSLMPELVDRIGSCLLDTADLDCYMALRAVCHNWRGATVDPKNTLHIRFRPHRWIMLDYSSHGEDVCLLVNTVSGRYHGRDMPLLRKYYIISITIDGLLVLMAKIPPHAVCVLNPFTGHMVHFVARMRPNVLAAAVSNSSPPRLVLYCHDTMKLYMASPDTASFIRYITNYACPFVRKVVQGCVAVDGHQGLLPPLPATVVAKIADLLTPLIIGFPPDIQLDSQKSCFLVESAGEILVIFKLVNRVEVFKMDGMGGNMLVRVKNIGSRSIFIGRSQRCLSLDADKFPSIEANCIYFTECLSSPSTDIYHLKDGEQVKNAMSVAGGAGPSMNLNMPAFLWHSMTEHPCTIFQLLSLYTFNWQSGQASHVLEYQDSIL
ncbi:hypothetical protein CFC21_005953 [Triticum aestivum]|uniref:KIB1-4 beta-propeller domain-containing protein n=2 Tax=Triticum aestivum TaxID=4565 RepID=A0A9R1IPS1_WHEAT|nr:hypothetical protein CFC21_005953 [Triticum aestivum]